MRAVQTFWTSQTFDGGWLSAKYHLASWALSAFQLSKRFNNCLLITNNYGYHILIEFLELPYTEVSLSLNDFKTNFEEIWVLKKIRSYSLQHEPFVHVDGDAYLFHPLPSTLISAPLICQNFEFNHPYYFEVVQQIKGIPGIPNFISNIDTKYISSINAGLIGGNQTSFFKYFEEEILDFLNKHYNSIENINVEYLNIFLEQCCFQQLVTLNGIDTKYLITKKIGYPYKYNLDRFTDLPSKCDYIHVMNYKRNPTVCEQMAQRLWLESPELYERVLTVCRQLDATHHPISLPDHPQPLPFYRTHYIFHKLQLVGSLSSLSKQQLIALVAATPEGDAGRVVSDVFQFESGREKFAQSLPEPSVCWQQWQQYSHRTNELLSLPAEQYTQQLIRQSSQCVRLDSEWNWAEANEFAGQTADRNFADNMTAEPSYYEVLLYYYPHQQTIREQLLDTLNMLILDAIDEPSTIQSITDTVIEQILEHQPEANQKELSDTIISRIRHFLYHGVLDVVL